MITMARAAFWKARQRVIDAAQGRDKRKAMRQFLSLCILLTYMEESEQ